MKQYLIILTIAAVLGIVGTLFAVSDRYIAKATFVEFKEHIIYRLDAIDKKLDIIITRQS